MISGLFRSRGTPVLCSLTYRSSSFELKAVVSFLVLLIALLTNLTNRYVFVVVVFFSFAVLLQSPTKWYMKLVPVSQLICATLFHLCIHSDHLHLLLPVSLSWFTSFYHVCASTCDLCPLCCIHVIYCTANIWNKILLINKQYNVNYIHFNFLQYVFSIRLHLLISMVYWPISTVLL